ncbi:MAG: barstar family protein [Candidatus Levyibacteriota bacterium]
MKLPELTQCADAGVIEYHGHSDTIAAAAGHAGLRFLEADLGGAADKASLFAALAHGLGLPEHFGNNFDALADSLEDRDWLGKTGCVVHIRHAAHFRKAHPHDWETLEEILSEAADFWRERHLAFWVLVG